MRHLSASPSTTGAPSPTTKAKSGWETLATLIPYLWEYRGRVLLALLFLLAAKLANVGVPLIMKEIVDAKPTREFEARWGNGFIKADTWVSMLVTGLRK